jgi:hypothetical protein
MYQAEISRANPTAYIFVIDQSASMNETMASGRTKAQFVADVVNKTLRDLVVRCTREEGVRDYFDVAVLQYGDNSVRNALAGALSSTWLHPISTLADNTLRVEDRQRQVDDGAGGLVTQTVKFPVWIDAHGSGGTPMQAAMAETARLVASWSDAHPTSFPPTVLHITDGESTDGDPEHNATVVKSLTTNDGSALLYNVHVTSANVEPLRYPSSETAMPDKYAQLVFRMSSTFPPHVRDYARDAYGITLTDQSRAMVLNADAEELVKFIDIGSRPAAMR